MSRLLTRLIHALPLTFALAFGRVLGRLLWWSGVRRRVMLENLARAFPERTPAEHQAIARATWANLGSMAVEFLRAPWMTAEEVREQIEIVGYEHVERALAAGRGILVATAHFGNFELLAASIPRMGLPLHIVTRKMAANRGNDLWRETRARAGVHEIPERDSVRQILGVLRRNEVLGVVIDQNMRPPRGIFVPFFGVPAATLTLPAVMAERTGAAVLTAFMVRQPGGRHRLHLEPFDLERVSEDRGENVRHNTARLNAVLETWIRRHPDHWYWVHRRWKTRPPEEAPPEGVTRNRAA